MDTDMQQILNIPAVYRQTMQVPVENSTTPLQLLLEYNPVQYAWFMSVTWNTFSVNALQVTASPNLLRQWKNTIPFGIMVTNTANIDPITLEDFASGVSTMYVLNATDVATFENLFGW